MQKPTSFCICSLFIVLGMAVALRAQGEAQPLVSFQAKVFVGDGSDEAAKPLLQAEEMAKPGILIFITGTEDKSLELVKTVGLFIKDVTKEKSPNMKLVYLAKSEPEDAVAKTNLKKADLAIPAYIYAGDGPDGYDNPKKSAMTVVIWAKSEIKSKQDLTAEKIAEVETLKGILLKFLQVSQQ